MPKSFLRHLISMACTLLSVSAGSVQDSQAYRNMDMTRERISLIFELSAIFLSFQMVLSLASAAVAWAILARISGLDPSSAMIAPRYLNDVTCHQVIATKYGEGVLIRHGSGRAGNVACFQLCSCRLIRAHEITQIHWRVVMHGL